MRDGAAIPHRIQMTEYHHGSFAAVTFAKTNFERITVPAMPVPSDVTAGLARPFREEFGHLVYGPLITTR
jgi:hypothetical protein